MDKWTALRTRPLIHRHYCYYGGCRSRLAVTLRAAMTRYYEGTEA